MEKLSEDDEEWWRQGGQHEKISTILDADVGHCSLIKSAKYRSWASALYVVSSSFFEHKGRFDKTMKPGHPGYVVVLRLRNNLELNVLARSCTRVELFIHKLPRSIRWGSLNCKVIPWRATVMCETNVSRHVYTVTEEGWTLIILHEVSYLSVNCREVVSTAGWAWTAKEACIEKWASTWASRLTEQNDLDSAGGGTCPPPLNWDSCWGWE